MQRSWILATLVITLVGCYGPQPFEPGRMGRDLDSPPRYGEANRYFDPAGPPPGPVASDLRPLEPRGSEPGGAPGVNVDPGLTVTPPNSSTSTTTTTTTTVPAPGPTTQEATPPAPSPAPGSVPYARAVPGKPGFVYSPHEAGKILDVTGLRPGTKVKDPQTGAMFRVP